MPKAPNERKPQMDTKRMSGGDAGADGKDPAAKSLGAKGGRARAKALSAEQRAEIAQIAARARWKKKS